MVELILGNERLHNFHMLVLYELALNLLCGVGLDCSGDGATWNHWSP